jgi:hypothetical protein
VDIYSGKVRLAGDMRNEVRRGKMTAPEVILLKRIHGEDAVLELEKVGNEKVNHQEERQRLYRDYPTAINIDAKRHLVEELFGPNHNDLPTSVPGVAITPKTGKVKASDIME